MKTYQKIAVAICIVLFAVSSSFVIDYFFNPGTLINNLYLIFSCPLLVYLYLDITKDQSKIITYILTIIVSFKPILIALTLFSIYFINFNTNSINDDLFNSTNSLSSGILYLMISIIFGLVITWRIINYKQNKNASN